MTAREWTGVGLRALAAVICAVVAVVAIGHGGDLWLEIVAAASMAAVYFGIVAYERWSSARFQDAMRRYHS